MVYRATLSPMFTLRRDLDRIFEDAFGRGTDATATWRPTADVREDDAAYHFEIELPGIPSEQVEVNIEQGVLSVSGEARRAGEKFKRTFKLPQGIAEERIEATFANGLLSVVVPKEQPKARKIEVKK